MLRAEAFIVLFPQFSNSGTRVIDHQYALKPFLSIISDDEG
jgi:hypothetical protein